MRRLDQGLPVHAIWTRKQYLLSQFRHQVALLLVPLLILMAWFEFVPTHLTPMLGYAPHEPHEPLLIAGAGCVFLFTPVMMRYIWHTQPLPAGDILGLPIGISFIGAEFSDAKLIQFAYALEQAGYVRQPPALR